MMTLSADIEGGGNRSRAFWLRLSENLFRRLPLFILPIVVMGAIGIFQASRVTPTYSSDGVLSAASNPLVTEQQIRGAGLQNFESPAAGTSRIINEQLRTASFTTEVARRAGLSEPLEDELITLDTIRDNVVAFPDGNSLLTVSATWDDPVTSFQLAEAVIDTYRTYLLETVASDSQEAEEYYRGLLADAEAELNAAEQELTTLLDGLPIVDDEADRPIDVRLEIQNLTSRIDRAEEQKSDAQRSIDDAELAVLQSRSEAGRSVQVIDEPEVPEAPDSTLQTQIVILAGFLALGAVISAIMLLLRTAFDHSATSPDDVLAIPEVNFVALVPPIGAIDAPGGRRSRGRRGRLGPAPSSDPDADDEVPERVSA